MITLLCNRALSGACDSNPWLICVIRYSTQVEATVEVYGYVDSIKTAWVAEQLLMTMSVYTHEPHPLPVRAPDAECYMASGRCTIVMHLCGGRRGVCTPSICLCEC